VNEQVAGSFSRQHLGSQSSPEASVEAHRPQLVEKVGAIVNGEWNQWKLRFHGARLPVAMRVVAHSAIVR